MLNERRKLDVSEQVKASYQAAAKQRVQTTDTDSRIESQTNRRPSGHRGFYKSLWCYSQIIDAGSKR